MKHTAGVATYDDVKALESAGLPDLPASTYELIRQGAMRDPEAPALSFFLRAADHRNPETWTYQKLLASIHQTANFFHALGARRDTVIAYVLPNLPETHFVIWGGQAAGIVAAINPLLEPDAIADLLNAAGATILVTLAPFPGTDLWMRIQQVLPRVPGLRHLVLVNLADRVRGGARLAAHLLQKREQWRLHGVGGITKSVPATLSMHDFGSAIRRYSATELQTGRVIGPDDFSSFFCTGGTTGTPKIAMRTHRNEVANAISAGCMLGDGIGSGKTVFCGLPLFHVNAVLVTGLLPFHCGAHVLLGTPQGYRGEGVIARFWEIVEYHRINFFSGVPTLYAGLLQVPIKHHQVDSLEYGLCGAAPMPVEVLRRFQDSTGIKILEGYGLTEATCVSSVNPPQGIRRPGSIGLRLPGQQMKAVLLDEHQRYLRDCAIDETGVILVSGANVFAGYRLAEQNTGLWVDLGDGRKWLNTGDLGRQDAEGYFWLTGRKKELIIRGGHNIDPAMIEEPLHAHPAVQMAAAVGRPDAHAGELPVVYVQLRPGARVSEQELLEFAARSISERAAIPKFIRIVEEIPLTSVGKIFKPALKRQEVAAAIDAALREAGVIPASVQVEEDKRRGTMLAVSLQDAVAKGVAEQVVGRFPFPCRFD